MMNAIQKTVSVDCRRRLFIAVLLAMIVSPVFSVSITVLSPNGSEQIPAGYAFPIEWDSVDLVSDVRIEYSIDDGANWTPVIDQDLPNTGTFVWDPVPATYTSSALIKIYAVSDVLVTDTSDNPFYIYACLSKIRADLNNDCYVDLEDSTLLASMWMLCANPLDPFCDTECPEGYGDCDGLLFNGCEVSLLTDINNCGLCGHICAFANAEALCVDGHCVMGNCLPGYSDLNGDPNDGCESECVWISETDLPDDDFIDANCDGIDGEIEKAVFVDSLTGDNTNPGTTPELPLLTIQAGINAAVAYGRDYVLISEGTYNESLSLASGVSLYGSYNASAGWERSSSYITTITGGTQGLYSNVVSNMTIAHLTISSADALESGQSSYAVFLTSASDISIHNCTLKAGKGTTGAAGSNGVLGSNGGAGQAGQPGCENDTGVSCSTCALPSRGIGGSSPAGYAGGRGGTPGLGTLFGLDGVTPTGGGSGGAGGLSTMDGEPGQSGNNGDNGINGSGGSFFGIVSASGYTVSSGTAGTAGQTGRGGGGGGGGGGGPDGIDYCDSYGGAGGGGGGGAAGGGKGTGGQGGGGSFGIWLYQCTSIDITACTIQTANGGNGGNGGTGGQGGLGGIGGSGGIGEDDSGNGGAGGDGGNGGDGGHGAGGGGGPSIGILADSSSSWSQSGNIFVLGSAGTGGTSPGNPGSVGLATNVYSTE